MSSWYVETGYERAYAHSTDCYGKLRALDHLPDVSRRADAMKVYEMIRGVQDAAFLSAQSLDLKPAVVNKALTEKNGLLRQPLFHPLPTGRPAGNRRADRGDRALPERADHRIAAGVGLIGNGLEAAMSLWTYINTAAVMILNWGEIEYSKIGPYNLSTKISMLPTLLELGDGRSDNQ